MHACDRPDRKVGGALIHTYCVLNTTTPTEHNVAFTSCLSQNTEDVVLGEFSIQEKGNFYTRYEDVYEPALFWVNSMVRLVCGAELWLSL